MKRTIWEFNYTAEELLNAATTKNNWHQLRLEWWKNKKEEVMVAIKKDGLTIDESVAMGYSNSGRSTSVMVDTQLQRDLNECVGKINEHEGKVKDYSAWVEVLSATHPSLSFALHQEDWLFFFGK